MTPPAAAAERARGLRMWARWWVRVAAAFSVLFVATFAVVYEGWYPGQDPGTVTRVTKTLAAQALAAGGLDSGTTTATLGWAACGREGGVQSPTYRYSYTVDLRNYGDAAAQRKIDAFWRSYPASTLPTRHVDTSLGAFWSIDGVATSSGGLVVAVVSPCFHLDWGSP